MAITCTHSSPLGSRNLTWPLHHPPKTWKVPETIIWGWFLFSVWILLETEYWWLLEYGQRGGRGWSDRVVCGGRGKEKAVPVCTVRYGRMCEFHFGWVEGSEDGLLLPMYALAPETESRWAIYTRTARGCGLRYPGESWWVWWWRMRRVRWSPVLEEYWQSVPHENLNPIYREEPDL